MKKIYFILFCSLAISILLFGCGPDKKLKPSMNMRSLSEKILDEADIDSIALVDDNSINSFLEGSGIEKEMLADHSINVPSEDEFEMLIILEAKNDEDTGVLKQGLRFIDANYEDRKAAGSVILTKGRYVMLVNCEENDTAREIFETSID